MDAVDKSTLLRIEKIISEDEHGDNWWAAVPDDVKESIDSAIEELDKGQGIPHETIKKMYPQWFKK